MTKAFATPRGAMKGKSQLTFSLARSREDLTDAFRLAFEAYHSAGLVGEKPSGIRLTPYHLLPTSEVILAKCDGDVTSTVSMFGDGYLGLPMQSMYPREIGELRDRGLRLAEVGGLADRRRSQARFIKTFAEMGRLLAQVAYVRGIDALVAATHPRHARLYQRVLGFRVIGELTECPYANGNPAVALYISFEEQEGTPVYEQYFGELYPQKDLAPYRWDRETRQHFRHILERDNQINSMAGIAGYYNWAVVTGALNP